MPHPLFDTITTFARKHHLFSPEDTVIIGLSGGPDSVFLLHYLKEHQDLFGIKLIAAHLDHEWRTESHKDAAFCQELCLQLGVPLVALKLSELGMSWKFNGSKEELGRKARRHFFDMVCKEHHAHAIALGHHADDQQETFFIRLLRGASLTGLTGMRPRQGNYVRPLLSTHKTDILAWLAAHNITYLTDPTNNSDAFLRNRIRNHVVPALHTCDQRFNTSFAATLQQLQATEQYLDNHVSDVLAAISTVDSQGVRQVNTTSFLQLHSVMQQRILLRWLCEARVPHTPRQQLWHELVRFIQQAGNGAHALHSHWQLHKKNNQLSLQQRNLV